MYGNSKARSDALRTFTGGLLRSRTRIQTRGKAAGAAAGAAGTDNDTATVDTVDTSIAIEEYLPLGTDGGGGPDAGHGLANAMKLPRSSLFFTGEREREREMFSLGCASY